ncbi:MAG: AMP-binding protein [Geminicoccaceae bacterium]|nr:AMP-binding protein [Geminicoccaceae bacterium]
MRDLLTLGQMLAVHARLRPNALGARDLERALSFAQWNTRSRKLANALAGLGLTKGDRIAVLAYNCLEWLEIFAAAAKAGLVVTTLNFRGVPEDHLFVIEDAEAGLLICQAGLEGAIEAIRDRLRLPPDRFVLFGAPPPAGWRSYEDLLARGADREPEVAVAASDPWTLLYTSGTTGKPKGVVRSHRAAALLSLVTEIELGLHREDEALLVMPLCHANSVNFFCAFTYCGAAVSVYSRKSFDPAHFLKTFAELGASFTSLVPTQYVMLLELPAKDKEGLRLDRAKKLMISSAPAREETKRAVMEMFPAAGLFELYGSSEGGWVTMLHPHEQLDHLGTVGRECVGTKPIRFLDDAGNEVPDGTPGELFHATPYTFDYYWKRPDATAEAFRGEYCTVGDVGLRDEQGYIRLLDRKKNMIITGGENVYPAEVEQVLARHPAIREVAVIGLPDPLWGERVHAVVALQEGARLEEGELLDWARPRLAGYKRPRSCTFLALEEFPRTATGKIQHRVLREKILARERR